MNYLDLDKWDFTIDSTREKARKLVKSENPKWIFGSQYENAVDSNDINHVYIIGSFSRYFEVLQTSPQG